MGRRDDRKLVVGLDIGTSKISAIVGEISPEDRLEVIGIGSNPSRGLKRGVVVNIESTVQSIQRAIEEAELMAGCEINTVLTGIAGSHVRSLNSHGIVAIRDKEVSAAQNVVKCVQRCGLTVEDMVLEQLASSYAVLTDDEKELGVCLVDMGGGTTDIAIFCGGAIQHTAVIPIAGDQVTNDIAVSLRTPLPYAEEIKIKYACALSQLANPDETIEVPSVGDRPPRRLARQTLAEVVEPRYEELFQLVREELRRSGFEEMIAAGVVLTGGSAKMEGAIELAEEVFHMPVRLGVPQFIDGLSDVVRNPIHATGVGLLLYSKQAMQAKAEGAQSRNGFSSTLDKMKAWFQRNL